jgi:hypothetical protein
VGDDLHIAPSPPKPWAVTIAQVLGAASGVAFAIGIARYFHGVWEWYRVGVRMIWMPVGTGIRITMLILIVVMLLQLPKRSQLGRWCGILLFCSALAGLINLVVTMDPAGRTPEQLGGFLIGFLVTFLPVAWLLYAFAFSRKARTYFSSSARD